MVPLPNGWFGDLNFPLPYSMALLVQGFPNHHHNTVPQIPPIAYFSFSGFGNPAACIIFGYSGMPLSLNTRIAPYAHHYQYDAYADHSDASSVHGPMPVPHVYKEERRQDLAFRDGLY